MDRDTSPRYTIVRGLFMSVCGLLIFAAIFRSCANTVTSMTSHPVAQARPAPPPNSAQRFCNDIELHDYSARNPEVVTISLKTGCFGVHVKLPVAWATYFIQKSQQQGDWAAVWCAGRPLPGDPRFYYEDMGNNFNNCRETNEQSDDFYLQGQGTISFRRTTVVQGYESKLDPEAVEANYKLTPIDPSSGNHDGYSMTIEQCYRAGEDVHCWGRATNLTDAPTTLVLHGGTVVDDEGNSTRIGRMYFPGAGDGYFTGSNQHLLPNVPTKLILEIHDPHQNVKTLNLEAHTDWEAGGFANYEALVYKDVPVQ